MSLQGSAHMSMRRSRGRNAAEPPIDLASKSAADILQSLIEMKRSVAYAELECGYMERYLERNDPELLLGITKIMQRTAAADTKRIQFAIGVSGQGDEAAAIGSVDSTPAMSAAVSFISMTSARTAASSSIGQHQTGVNYAMKIELVDKDRAIFAGDIDRLRQATTAELRDCAARAEDLRLSRDEAVDTLAEFRDFVLVKGRPLDSSKQQQRRDSVPLERFLTFIDKWVIHGNGMVEQMRLRTATLEQETRAQTKALAIKAELSGILLPVDFEQMEIERLRYGQAYADRELHLLGLKRVAGNVSLALAKQRQLLEQSMARLAAVRRRTTDVKAESAKFESARESVEEDIDGWQERVDRLAEHRAMYAAPSTMQYMDQTRRLQALEREVRMLRRHEQIARGKERTVRARVRRCQGAVGQRVSREVTEATGRLEDALSVTSTALL